MKKMFKEFRKTLAKVMHLRSVVGYNSLVYALKKTPLIGKVLPDRLYSTTFLKVIYWVVHIIREVFALFFTKMAGLGSVYVASLIVVTLYYSVDLMGDMTKQYAFGMFALLFFLLRDILGYGTLSLPVPNGIKETYLFNSYDTAFLSFFATIPGALLLLVLCMSFLLTVQLKMNAIEKAGVADENN